MNSEESNDATDDSIGAQFKQISGKQWLIAAVVLIAIPIISYTGAFYLYPYITDQLEGGSPIEGVLAEYGVSEDAETQLLTVRRGDLVNSVAVNGSLEYANRERLKFGLAGTVSTVNIEEGDFVNEGDVLVSLDNESIVAAEQSLQNANVALQDAQERLDELINPADQLVEEARLKALQAWQSLEDSEDKLDNLTSPSPLEVANADLAIVQARQTLDDLRAQLDDLETPSNLAIQNAALAVSEAEDKLRALWDELSELTTQDDTDLANANQMVAQSAKDLADAQDALSELEAVDIVGINQAELDIDKARLGVETAEAAVIDAEMAVLDAIALADDVNFTSEKVKLESDVTAAQLALKTAEDNYSDASEPADQDAVADLKQQIEDAEWDVSAALINAERSAIDINADVEARKQAWEDARAVYQDVFQKWLGMDPYIFDEELSPDEIFTKIGASLKEIMTSSNSDGSLLTDRYNTNANLLVDDPDTAWDEVVVAVWSEFFLGELRFECTELGTGITPDCVNIEFENAWDDLQTKSDAYRKATLNQELSIADSENAVNAARSRVEDLEEQLAELSEPADDEVLADLMAKLELARVSVLNAQDALQRFMSTSAARQEELDHNIEVAEQQLTVARLDLTVANDKVDDAVQHLADLQKGADSVDVELASARVKTAEIAVQDAEQALADLIAVEEDTITLVEQRIETAEADLADKVELHREIATPDQDEVRLVNQQIIVAESDLTDKQETLQNLIDPDPEAIALAEQEVVLARVNLQSAEDDWDALVNPDAATVALRRAELATAREAYSDAILAVDSVQIIAPFDGVISLLSVESGQSVNPQTTVVEIADSSIVEVSGTVDEIDVLFLQVGDTASISLEALGDEQLVGRISSIAAFGDNAQGVVTYPVTIQTEQPDDVLLPEGLSAVAEVIIREQSDALLVPIQSLFGSVNDPILLISKDDGTLEPRSVNIGISDDFWSVVEDGVSEGETLLMTVVGSDTSQFSGFRAISSSVRFASGPGGPTGGR